MPDQTRRYERVFSHENHAFPPSLSNLGEMRSGKKSDLLTCLDQKLCYTEHVYPLEQACSTFSAPDTIPDKNVPTEDLVVFDNMLEVDLVQVSSEMVLDDTNFPSQGTTDQTAKILDGAFIVHMLSPKLSKTFQDNWWCVYAIYRGAAEQYAQVRWCMGCIHCRELTNKYKTEKRSWTAEEGVAISTYSSDWKGFLRNDANKQDLFAFLEKKKKKKREMQGIWQTDCEHMSWKCCLFHWWYLSWKLGTLYTERGRYSSAIACCWLC